ncbi:hypothetical protein GCM10011386_38910 [Parapedobacter defluvii]|uniref:WD40-like Beta Propeller Repeat n=1 Tax=Parapedobacter defluvii TaxID=2045106 RepID=A0ABQ1MTU3_9SPHI|nr:PD40 domain-containing protein [Parapedobacter defluvii]GGC42857.1 hypothetical protein GCM10011386_38910 [Parapedobacter defluvii]
MKKLFCIGTAIGLLLSACSKNNDPEPNEGGKGYGTGYIFNKQGLQGIRKLNLSNGELTDVLPPWPHAGWDISWNGKTGVKKEEPASYDTRYIIFDVANGATIREINYEPDGYRGGLPYLSPDGKLLALSPTLDEGLVILDMDGRVLKNISGYGVSHDFEYLDPIAWEPSGAILFKKDGGLWRTSPDFSRATKVRDIPFSDWKGEATASPDGKKIAIPAGNHIWLMNSDGSDFHAITESSQKEIMPSFSPDSKFIAIAANARSPEIPGSSENAFHLCLIPADGQVYKVYPGEDKRVIHPVEKGASNSSGLGMTIVGDFVWR